jgi:hypothetical protein
MTYQVVAQRRDPGGFDLFACLDTRSSVAILMRGSRRVGAPAEGERHDVVEVPRFARVHEFTAASAGHGQKLRPSCAQLLPGPTGIRVHPGVSFRPSAVRVGCLRCRNARRASGVSHLRRPDETRLGPGSHPCGPSASRDWLATR